MRAKLQAAADRFDQLRSFRGSALVEVAEDSGDEPSPVACVAVAGERRQPGDADDRADLRVYEGDCGASPDVEVIAIGAVSSGPRCRTVAGTRPASLPPWSAS